ncbi:MAG: TolC family protein [Syntrophomonadaceae bacterium]|nr:TolC family protein [Syntrophomonadaceae bacterium]MDD3023332.1 TolC family protein [Syntrophomonadaceae bacterium]
MLKNYLGKSIIAVSICLILIGSLSLNSGAETANAGNEGNSPCLVLTIEDAEKRALARSNDLKMADYSIEQGELNRNTAADNVGYIPADGDWADVSSAYLKLIQSDINWQMTKKEKEASTDTIKKNVFQKYTNVLNAQEKVKAAEKALEYAAFQRLAARVGYQVKKESLSSQNTAERNYVAKEAALAKSKNALEDSWRSFNSLLGLNAKERPVLQDDPQFSAYQIDDLELEVLRNMDINPDIWLANKKVEQAQLAVDLYTWNNGGESYAVKKLAVDKAALSAADTKEQARESIISAYNNIYNLGQQYQTTLRDLEAAEEDLNITKLKFEMGTVSKGDVLKAEADLATLQQTLKSTVYEHELAEITFDKPWAN